MGHDRTEDPVWELPAGGGTGQEDQVAIRATQIQASLLWTASNCVFLPKKTLESLSDSKEIKPVNPKRNQL